MGNIKTVKIGRKEVVILSGRGENCTCPDCPVLYGGPCLTTDENNKRDKLKKKAKAKKPKKKKRKKIKVFCRLYKYLCAGCNRERHKRHFIQQGELCTGCLKLQPPKDQISLFN